ncbi:MAG: hypothetical protein Q4D99_01500 [Bacillota bacterium]|nr:hypothetical protein [Bacillota bacterium]
MSSYEEILARDGKLVYTNKGVSMMPLIGNGEDMLIISPRPVNTDGSPAPLKKYDVVLYKRGEKYILHRILKVVEENGKREYVICGDNQYRREFGVKDEQIIGVLTGIVRPDGTSVDLDSYVYQDYVHRTCDFFYPRAAGLYCKSRLAAVKRKLSK